MTVESEEQAADPPAVAAAGHSAVSSTHRQARPVTSACRSGPCPRAPASARRRPRPGAASRRAARPRASACRKPASKESPAPVVSTGIDAEGGDAAAPPPVERHGALARRASPRCASRPFSSARSRAAESRGRVTARELDLVRDRRASASRQSRPQVAPQRSLGSKPRVERGREARARRRAREDVARGPAADPAAGRRRDVQVVEPGQARVGHVRAGERGDRSEVGDEGAVARGSRSATVHAGLEAGVADARATRRCRGLARPRGSSGPRGRRPPRPTNATGVPSRGQPHGADRGGAAERPSRSRRRSTSLPGAGNGVVALQDQVDVELAGDEDRLHAARAGRRVSSGGGSRTPRPRG